MRAVLDPNVLISALLSAQGTSAALLRAWQEGRFELVVSPSLLEELGRALGHPKLQKHITSSEAEQYVASLRAAAEVVPDGERPPTTRSRDPADDYLLAVAEQERAALATGDEHLLELRQHVPVFAPATFMSLLDERLG